MTSTDYIIFDIDGLVLDTEPIFTRAKDIVLPSYGYPNIIDTAGAVSCNASAELREKMASVFGKDYPIDEISQAVYDKVDEIIEKEGVPVKRGIRELIAFLKKSGIRFCAATNTPRKSTLAHIRKSGLDENDFDFFICGDEIERSKPDPEIFLECLERSGKDPLKTIVIEDSEPGIRAAGNAGIPVICIPDSKEPADDVRHMTLATLENAGKVIDIIENIERNQAHRVKHFE